MHNPEGLHLGKCYEQVFCTVTLENSASWNTAFIPWDTVAIITMSLSGIGQQETHKIMGGTSQGSDKWMLFGEWFGESGGGEVSTNTTGTNKLQRIEYATGKTGQEER